MTVPPAGVYLRALESRLSTTCPILTGSATADVLEDHHSAVEVARLVDQRRRGDGEVLLAAARFQGDEAILEGFPPHRAEYGPVRHRDRRDAVRLAYQQISLRAMLRRRMLAAMPKATMRRAPWPVVQSSTRPTRHRRSRHQVSGTAVLDSVGALGILGTAVHDIVGV